MMPNETATAAPYPTLTPAQRQVLAAWRTHILAAEAAIAEGDFATARAEALASVPFAEQLNEPRWLRRTGRALLALSQWGPSSALAARAERLEEPDGPPEWDGTPAPGATLVIEERRNEHVGRPIRFARFIPLAAARVKRCVVLVEPRLVTLFQRSFPNVEVRALSDNAIRDRADFVAGYHTLIALFGYDDAALIAGFTPLVPDAAQVAAFRAQYGTRRPLIGMSWMSTNEKKILPTLDDWGAFMRSVDATYVSLQYGDVSADAEVLRKQSGRTLIVDDTVDSLKDFDRYAAQTAAMDAVVNISGTGGHMAGALGKRTFVPLDSSTKLYWPDSGNTIAWYPSTTFLRRHDQTWHDIFAEIRPLLTDYLARAWSPE